VIPADDLNSKLNALVAKVHAIWQESTPTLGTQMIFCDLGIEPNAWGFSVYDDILSKLAGLGIPRGQMAAMGDADTDAKKQSLFEQVRAGKVRVLLGSTAKMGAGTNVQKRLIALHHLDAPWKPAEVEQREGRILRQGNTNPEVQIFRYVTEGSFDAYLWQALETKARFISQVMTGESALRQAGDVGGQELSYAEVKAIASGNPAVLTLAEADAELQRLAILRRNHADEQFLARRAVRDLPDSLTRQRAYLGSLQADAAITESHARDPLQIQGAKVPADQVMNRLGAMLDELPSDVPRTRRFPLGVFRGLAFAVDQHPGGATDVVLTGQTDHSASLAKDAHGPRAVLNALHRAVEKFPEVLTRITSQISLDEKRLTDFQARLGQTFPHTERFDTLTALRDQLRISLTGQGRADGDEIAKAQEELNEQVRELLGDGFGKARLAKTNGEESHWQKKLDLLQQEHGLAKSR
jgi:hypothetical protein